MFLEEHGGRGRTWEMHGGWGSVFEFLKACSDGALDKEVSFSFAW